jgi:hypothetical protein
LVQRPHVADHDWSTGCMLYYPKVEVEMSDLRVRTIVR